MTTRRDFLKLAGAGAAAAGMMKLDGLRAMAAAPASTKPNVLLIILEDWGPFLGCYGVKEMQTPHLDQLASEGRRYNACFTSCPVCSPGRSSLFTGVSQYTVHSEQHRTPAPLKQALPEGIPSVPEIFRDSGYFTALGCGYGNKIDLNFKFATNEIFLGDDWNQRKAGQPFFAHLTLLGTHRAWRGDPIQPIDPARVSLPPWYPDTPLTRKDWAMGLECAQVSDRSIGEIVARLKREGLYENTAIVITADHGVALPRAKQFLYDDGLHIPLIIRWPARAKAGTVSDELVSNVDVLPTILGIAGLPAHAKLQGRDILDPATPPRRYVFAGRDKMDDTHDASRAVRSKDYKYILNLMPERPWCQFNEYKETSYPGLSVLNVLHLEGKLPPEQDAFMKPVKPAEELYDLRTDPHELHNLAGEASAGAVLKEMRAELEQWRKQVGDPGITEAFRKEGWPATYPDRPLEEWKRIQAEWENKILRGGPAPKIPMPADAAAVTPPAAKKKGNAKKKKAKNKTRA